MLLLELLGCWGRYEDVLQAEALGKDPGDGAAECRQTAPLCAEMLSSTVPIVLQIFSHENSAVCATVLPALNKLISTLRAQGLLPAGHIQTTMMSFPGKYFVAAEYVPMLLSAVYRQLQYDADFGFDANDDDDVAIMEVRLKREADRDIYQ